MHKGVTKKVNSSDVGHFFSMTIYGYILFYYVSMYIQQIMHVFIHSDGRTVFSLFLYFINFVLHPRFKEALFFTFDGDSARGDTRNVLQMRRFSHSDLLSRSERLRNT